VKLEFANESGRERESLALIPLYRKGKSLLHPLNYGVDYLTLSTMKRFILLLNFPKPVKLPPGGFETADLIQ
jgi:hypothetical protein